MKKTIKKLSTMLLSFAMVVNLSPASKMALFAGETETDKPAATESAETEAPKETEKPSAKETAKPTEKPSEEAAKPAEKDEEPVAETTKETPKPEAETSKETEASKETDESATETPDEPEEPAAKDPDETEVPEEPEGSDADIPEETEEPADKAPVESDKPEADEPKTDAGSKRAPDESDAEDAKNWEYAEINNVKITNGILTWDPDASATDYYLSIDQDDNYAYCYFDAPANSYNIKKQIDIWIKSSQIKKPKNNIYTYVLWEYRSGMTARHEGTYSYKSSAKPYKIGKISSVKYSNGKLSWKKYSGAVKYGFSIDYYFKGELYTSSTSYNINATIDQFIKDRRMFKQNSYDITIYAYDKDDVYMAYWEGTIKYQSKATPCEVPALNASITDDILTWEAVAGAVDYELRVVGPDLKWTYAWVSNGSCNLKTTIANLIEWNDIKEFSSYTLELTAWKNESDVPIAEWTGSYKYKEPNTLKASSKTAKVKYNKKKNKTVKRASVIKITDKGQGDITYKKVSGNSKFTINSKTGNITVKKKLKKKTYTIKVKVIAAGDETTAMLEKILTIKIKLK